MPGGSPEAHFAVLVNVSWPGRGACVEGSVGVGSGCGCGGAAASLDSPLRRAPGAQATTGSVKLRNAAPANHLLAQWPHPGLKGGA